MSIERSYFKNIEFLRIIFTLVIVIYHVLQFFRIETFGYLGVEFFFILSGFFLMYTFNNEKTLFEFMLKKITRFLPLIMFTTIIYSLIKGFDFFVVLPGLFFIPYTGLCDDCFVGPGTVWYIDVLFWVSIFYFYLIKTQKPSTVNIIIGLLTFVGYLNSVYWGNGITEVSEEYGIFILNKGMIRGLSSMGLGYFVALNYLNFSHKDNKPTIFFTFLEAVVLIFILVFLFYPYFERNDLYLYIFSFIFLIFLFLAKKGYISRYFEDDSCLKISKYCLSVFLTHPIIVNALCDKYRDFIDDLNICIELKAFAIVCLSILFGVGCYWIIEKPCERYLKKKLNLDYKKGN